MRVRRTSTSVRISLGDVRAGSHRGAEGPASARRPVGPGRRSFGATRDTYGGAHQGVQGGTSKVTTSWHHDGSAGLAVKQRSLFAVPAKLPVRTTVSPHARRVTR